MKKVSFILFGGTGDLTKKKISEAFVHLIKEKEIDKDSFLIGVSRKDLSDEEYKNFLVDSIRDKEDKKSLEKLNVKYAKGDFSKEGGLDKLKEVLLKNETKGSDRIYYFSTSFKFFPAISEALHNLHLDKNPHGTIKVVFEKPFGENLESFEKLNKGIKRFFSEKQIFRVDHYLGKKTVQNLNVLKFSNPIINYSLKGKNIESIEITVDEDLGVGNRIEYYNESGAINDMMQNHMLQVLSLVLMKKPSRFTSEKISSEKIKILKSLKILSPENHLLGQYKSYKEELKKAGLKDKGIETFSKIVLESKLKRWKGVKLVLRTGKKLKKKYGRIVINFKNGKKIKGFFEHENKNKIVLDIHPKQDVIIFLNAKNPYSNELDLVKFEFCEECAFGPNTPDAYSLLFKEIILGNKSLFATDKEVKESWRIIEKINKIKNKIKFVKYSDGSDPESR